MLVPRSRLIWWTAVIALPFAAAGATIPGALPISVAAISALVAAAVYDAVMAPGRLIGIRVVLPELVRLQKDRVGTMELRIENGSTAERALRIGLAFPRVIATAAEDRVTTLPAGAAWSRLDWELKPAERGQFFLERVYLEVRSPFGFWAARTVQPARAELRVYPDLLAERKHVAALFLRRGNLGSRAQRQVGQGRDFEKLREYVSGDSFEEIHWKASAKRGHPVTKVFQVERTQEVYVILDASRLSARKIQLEDGATTALERYVSAALILGAAAERQGDQFGLLTFSDRVLSFVRARGGAAHFDACRDRLYTLQPQSVTPDFDELCSFIRLRLRKRALLVFLTALDDPALAETFSRSVELICRQHLLLVNMLRPAGVEALFSHGDVEETSGVYRKLAGHLRWRDLRELETALRRRGVRFALLDPQAVAGELVAQHADSKGRQLL